MGSNSKAKKVTNATIPASPGTSAEDALRATMAAQAIASEAGQSAAAKATAMGAAENAAQQIGQAAADAAGQSTLKESSADIPTRLVNYSFKVAKDQRLTGPDNYRTWASHLELSKESAGWTPGAPLHILDDKMIGASILAAIAEGSPRKTVDLLKTGTAMEAALYRAYEQVDEERRSALLIKATEYTYAGGDPQKFNNNLNHVWESDHAGMALFTDERHMLDFSERCLRSCAALCTASTRR